MTRPRRLARRLLAPAAAIAAGLGAAVVVAGPAWAHGGDAPDGTNYRTEVTAGSPGLPGVTLRAVEAGALLELANRGADTVEVLGYDGEPYLEIRPDGVYENTMSPATYLNATLAGGEVPTTADATAAPTWRRVADEPVARWHDHRVHWMGSAPPPQVRADPDRPHRIRDWAVPLRVGVRTVEARGTLDWAPPPVGWAWWLAAALGVAAVGAVGLVAPRRAAGGRAWPGAALGAVAIAGGVAGIGYAVARELDAGSTGAGPVLLGLLAGQAWPVITGLGAVAAGVLLLIRRGAADFAATLAGTCLGLFAGVANTAVFSRGVAPVPFAPTLARLVVAGVIAAGIGLTVAGALRLRAAARELAGAAPAAGP